jgi:ABC-type nitrate/sulfonate/bicarbonate transport system ATPase subunit
VFVTHSLEEALAVGTRVALLTARPARVLRTWDVQAHADRHALAETLLGQLADQVRHQRLLDAKRAQAGA